MILSLICSIERQGYHKDFIFDYISRALNKGCLAIATHLQHKRLNNSLNLPPTYLQG